MIIDATDLIMGRMASFAAKQALRGENVDVINSEKAVITGSWDDVFAHYKQRRDRGHPYSGPFFQRREDRFLKKVIVGMLPHKNEKGRLAAKRVKCYISNPKNIQGKPVQLNNISINSTKNFKYTTLQKLCRSLGKKE